MTSCSNSDTAGSSTRKRTLTGIFHAQFSARQNKKARSSLRFRLYIDNRHISSEQKSIFRHWGDFFRTYHGLVPLCAKVDFVCAIALVRKAAKGKSRVRNHDQLGKKKIPFHTGFQDKMQQTKTKICSTTHFRLKGRWVTITGETVQFLFYTHNSAFQLQLVVKYF